MSEDKKYNGWTNYETWNVSLWMSNDEGSYNFWQGAAEELAEEIRDDFQPTYESQTREEFFACEMADRLKAHFEEQSQDMLDDAGQGASMWADLIGAALSEVNWYEIAEHLAEDLELEEEKEEVTEWKP